MHNRALQDRRVGVLRHLDVFPGPAQARSQRRGKRKEAHVRIARIGILGGLRDIFRDHQLALQGVRQSQLLQRSLGRAAVRSVFGICNCDGSKDRVAQRIHAERLNRGVVSCPEHQGSASVGNRLSTIRQAGGDHLLGKRQIRRQEERERAAIQNLRGQGGRGCVRSVNFLIRLLLKLIDERRQHRLEVGGRGNLERAVFLSQGTLNGGQNQKDQKGLV